MSVADASGSPKRDATVIIPQFGHTQLTRACLASLRRWEPAAWPVIVVDDGSPLAERCLRTGLAARDNSSSARDTRWISVRHRGVTAAWNVGISLARTEFVVLVNNDVRWQGPALEMLLQPLRAGHACVMGAQLRTECEWPSTHAVIGPAQPLWAGWCWAFRRRDWRALHGFDERFELYFSDTDFQLRLLQRQQAESKSGQPGPSREWRGPLSPLPLTHAAHATTRRLSDRRQIWQRDRALFRRKWS